VPIVVVGCNAVIGGVDGSCADGGLARNDGLSEKVVDMCVYHLMKEKIYSLKNESE
jgi:hypothetical protein